MTPNEHQEAVTTWRRMERMLPAPQRLDHGGIPVHRRKPLSAFYPRPGQEAMYEDLMSYIEWFPDNWRLGTGMTLVGAAGLGKTTLACAAAVTLVDTYEYVCAYTTLDAYIRDQQKLMSLGKLNDDADAREEMQRIFHKDWVFRRGAYLLVLDDVGREYRTGSGWAAQEFDSLLRERYDAGLPTIITTNMSVERWAGEYSPSMQSFVGEACPVVEVK